MVAINPGASFALSFVQLITLSLSKLSLLQRMASNDNGKCMLEEEAESLKARKRLWLYDDDAGDDDSSDSPEQETKEEVSLEETMMYQLDTSEEKLFAKRDRGVIFSDDVDTTLPSSEPRTPESHRRSNEDSSNEDDDDNNDFSM
jgi:hypothetical protein